MDPVVHVKDNDGNDIASADDNVTCTFPPVCGYECPSVQFTCVRDEDVAVIVRDFGAAENTGVSCNKGGGYELTVSVTNQGGNPAEVKIGGGAGRVLPDFARGDFPEEGPALDDEDVPSPSASNFPLTK